MEVSISTALLMGGLVVIPGIWILWVRARAQEKHGRRWKIAAAIYLVLWLGCLSTLVGQQISRIANASDHGNSDLPVPIFPGSVLKSRLPPQGEASYLAFGTYADPEKIRQYFTDEKNLVGWRYVGDISGNDGLILQDAEGRRLIVDVRTMSSCLLLCQHQITYWLTSK